MAARPAARRGRACGDGPGRARAPAGGEAETERPRLPRRRDGRSTSSAGPLCRAPPRAARRRPATSSSSRSITWSATAGPWTSSVASSPPPTARRARRARARAAPLAIQYADYAAWQRERLAAGALEPLGRATGGRGSPARCPLLALPTDHPRPARPLGPGGARVPFTLSAGMTAALRALGRREGATLFMTFLAGFALLLHRRDRADRSSSSALPWPAVRGRETEGLIGLFLDTLVLRVDCAERPTFRQLLGRARAAAFDAYAHQELPFEQRVVEAVRPDRGAAGTPPVSAFLNLHNQPARPLRLDRARADAARGAIERREVRPEPRPARDARGARGRLTYDADLFEPDAVRSCSRSSRECRARRGHPDRRLDEMALVSEAERDALVARGRGTLAAGRRRPAWPPSSRPRRRARRTPSPWSRASGRSATQRWSRGARGLAHRLRALGAGRISRWGVPRAVSRPRRRPPRRARGGRALRRARPRRSAGPARTHPPGRRRRVRAHPRGSRGALRRRGVR